jgi:DNA repair protein RecN (Recombination protein N)
VDAFGGDTTLLDSYREAFKHLQTLARRIGELKKIQKAKLDRLEILNARITEIGALDIQPDEDAQIDREYEVCLNAEKVVTALDESHRLLNTLDGSAMENIQNAKHTIERYSDVVTEVSPLVDRLNNAYIEVQDISEELLMLSHSIDLDQNRLEYLAQRRLELNHIKKKYSLDLNGVLALYQSSLEEVDTLNSSSSEIETLTLEKEQLLLEVTERAKLLSEHRVAIANRFTARVCEELKYLNMPNVVFEVKHLTGKLTLTGMDSMEFLISANLGEPPKPISKIASGGELSRIMLALKTVIADKDHIPTLIFDEIDTGVSGKTAQKIGYKLREVSKIRQVICVTHLTQIAVMGDNHLLIEKSTDGERTSTEVTQLDHDGRVHEIARIMNGETLTETALKNADELLTQMHSV